MIELTTRKGYFRLMKDKSSISTAIALQSILDEESPTIKSIEHDDGKEFQGEFDELLQQENIVNVTYPRQENSKTALGKVERLNLSIRKWWNKSFRGVETLDVAIPEIQEFYNQRKHSSTHQIPEETVTPQQIAMARNSDNLRGAEPRTKVRKLYHKGSEVRLREETDIFKKKSDAKWKRKTHIITAVNGMNFKVSGEDRDYRAWEMLPVGTSQKAPPRKILPPEPKLIPAGIRKLRKEIEPENIVEVPRTRAKNVPQNIPEKPKAMRKAKPQEVDLPEKIIGHRWIGNKLTFTIQWKDTPAFRKKWEKHKTSFVDWNQLISVQPSENFSNDRENNIVVADYLLSLTDRDQVKKIARRMGVALSQLDEVKKQLKRDERKKVEPVLVPRKTVRNPDILESNILTGKRSRK